MAPSGGLFSLLRPHKRNGSHPAPAVSISGPTLIRSQGFIGNESNTTLPERPSTAASMATNSSTMAGSFVTAQTGPAGSSFMSPSMLSVASTATATSRRTPTPLTIDPLAPRRVERPLTSPDFFFAGNFLPVDDAADRQAGVGQATTVSIPDEGDRQPPQEVFTTLSGKMTASEMYAPLAGQINHRGTDSAELRDGRPSASSHTHTPSSSFTRSAVNRGSAGSFSSLPRGPRSPTDGRPQSPLRLDTGLSGTSQYSTTIAPPRSGKRSNLLNPLSLLMRKRSSQSLAIEDSSISSLPDDYNPAIRGSFVHDFSAPRTSRTGSDFSHGRGAGSMGSIRFEDSDAATFGMRSPDKPHTPIFTEHFDDEHSAEEKAAREKIAPAIDTVREVSPSLTVLSEQSRDQTEGSRGNFSQQSTELSPPTSDDEETGKRQLSTLDNVVEEPDSDGKIGSIVKRDASMRSTHSKTLLPSTSRASRFSFEASGLLASAAQERMLEEAHKAKERAKQENTRTLKSAVVIDPYDEDYVPDDFDMDDYDDGFEEAIPGSGFDDDDDDGFGGFNHGGLGLQNMTLADLGTSSSKPAPEIDVHETKTVPSHIEVPPLHGFDFSAARSGLTSPLSPMPSAGMTPIDADGRKIGFAMTKEGQSPHWQLDPNFVEAAKALAARSPLSDTFSHSDSAPADMNAPPIPPMPAAFARPVEDDFYFDDGEFGGEFENDLVQGANGAAAFNEDVFDDEAGLFAVKQPPKNMDRQKADAAAIEVLREKVITDDRDVASALKEEPTGQTLTHSNLALLDKALSRVTDNKHVPDAHVFAPVDNDAEDDYYASGLDDADDDLEMIEFANASVLANDEDNFYASEFGYYAQSSNANAEFVAGGFFVKDEGLKRSRSGRAIEEPNLTPITERSECSARTSFAISALGDPFAVAAAAGHRSITTPDLRQIQRDLESGAEFDDMSLSTLLKLRRGAFGGSNGSLRSARSAGSVGSFVSQQEMSSPLANSLPAFGHSAGPSHNRMSSSALSADSHALEASSPVSPVVGGLSMPMREHRKGSIGSASSPLAAKGPAAWRMDKEELFI